MECKTKTYISYATPGFASRTQLETSGAKCKFIIDCLINGETGRKDGTQRALHTRMGLSDGGGRVFKIRSRHAKAFHLEENISPLGRLFYSVSTLQCMTCSLAYNGAGYGAAMGEANVRRVTQLAG
jgi:hypothetical protein